MDNYSQQAKRASPAPANAKKKAIRRKSRGGVPGYLQSKLKVSRVGDTQEQEADRVADRVSNGDNIQRSSLSMGDEEKEPLGESLQPKTLFRQSDEQEEETLQTSALLRQADAEETLQARSLLRQADQQEESLQAKALFRQADANEEALQTKALLRQEDQQ